MRSTRIVSIRACRWQQTLTDAFPWCADWADELTQLFRNYVEAKQAQQLLDYDDLLLYWHILVQEPALAAAIGARFSHVLVDEYQDTNTLQAEILLAMKPQGTGVCVVGDDAQAIYSFRAASIDNILDFPAHFSPPAQVVKLEHNYRSVQPILDAANALMREGARQYQKELHSDQRARSASLAMSRCRTITLRRCTSSSRYCKHANRAPPLRRQAVLMRTSHHSDVLEVELIRRNIPYVKYGGLKFLEAAHVKDVLATLRWIDNPRNQLAAFRVLQLLPGFGPANADRCIKVFAASGFDWAVLAGYQVPAAASEDWPALVALVRTLSAAQQWAGQLEQVRRWYEPHLQRIYDAAAVRGADIDQLGENSVAVSQSRALHHRTDARSAAGQQRFGGHARAG